jgi:hypothetical protein
MQKKPLTQDPQENQINHLKWKNAHIVAPKRSPRQAREGPKERSARDISAQPAHELFPYSPYNVYRIPRKSSSPQFRSTIRATP